MASDLAGFNSAPTSHLRPVLTACLDVPRWVETVLAGRPYADLAALQARADLTLEADEIRRAMAAHPRIGERATGASKTEQSGVDSATAERFRAANAEYEARFGHVFLVCASGRSGEELLADLRERLGNDPATELAVAGRELVKIAQLRLEKAVTA
ncbi:2-oxo-4-hydroxy-4-carboxy-5-ureidoimidazoline decarboxylase [Amycolatopsis bartoniae]|uniref:2-oxo-4-hydroxy-4-carboxy-5-ureidoimidazoline decarboxylase n=1 Tax=Amycolatopsis bartoniae TaxID=941986 RepID=UPI0011934F7A|nr:2-oxo-4-hydroxy-4-carboxy-5-ureidoimidazoline decarboxylase [Amycolatopsis bartoniae]MBB2935960.1 2-oxo-4-hydroxy-4-carboxy-5-ureidoimidazoline decarboxylase [Amycolatopsis bartoniae]TVT00464.1 2-oxo-4-hydroxy-4-carboxy-5-ureidoimidazoline decarboxylase [Amycolatopsis bartoniae]